MNLEAFEPECIEEILRRNGAQAVTLSDAGDDPVLEPLPGTTPLWRDTRITALFAADADFALLREDLGQSLGIEKLPHNHVETLEDRIWEREWLKDFKPMRFGERLWVLPGATDPLPDNAIAVRLDPGLAFGTGTHATTALCLEWLDNADIEGKTVLDLGCGSGILGIAALKLGAKSVMAVDIDPQALTATRHNALANDVLDRLETAECLTTGNRYDFVLANILARILLEQCGAICAAVNPGGALVLSGILDHQVADMMAAYSPHIAFTSRSGRDDWACLSGTAS